MFGLWVALLFYLLWLFESSDQKNAHHQQQLLRFRRRMGDSIFPWPWAFTRIMVYFLVFLTYFHAFLWGGFKEELIEQLWKVADTVSSLHIQITFLVWSRLPTILQW